MRRNNYGHPEIIMFLRILVVLFVMTILIPKMFTSLVESFLPEPSVPRGPHVREVYSPVRVTTIGEEIEVWWHLVCIRIRNHYLGE